MRHDSSQWFWPWKMLKFCIDLLRSWHLWFWYHAWLFLKDFFNQANQSVTFAKYQLIAPVLSSSDMSRSFRFATTNNMEKEILLSNTLLSDLFGHYCGFAPRRSFFEMCPWVRRRRAWGPERGGPPFSQSRGRREEGMKNMIYIIAVYCCYLVPSEQHSKAGRHFYEEGG